MNCMKCFQESARSSIERWVKLPVVRRGTIGSTLVGEPGKVRKYGRDQVAMVGVGRRQLRGVQVQDVARLGSCFRPRTCRNRQKLVLEYPLPITQAFCIVFAISQ